jgi:hypothetical protein
VILGELYIEKAAASEEHHVDLFEICEENEISFHAAWIVGLLVLHLPGPLDPIPDRGFRRSAQRESFLGSVLRENPAAEECYQYKHHVSPQAECT